MGLKKTEVHDPRETKEPSYSISTVYPTKYKTSFKGDFFRYLTRSLSSTTVGPVGREGSGNRSRSTLAVFLTTWLLMSLT